jgi:hypothetical protein
METVTFNQVFIAFSCRSGLSKTREPGQNASFRSALTVTRAFPPADVSAACLKHSVSVT